ncbi:MAG: Rieske (2Fe-2S) protein [Planctomycetaceae bacterium]|nr:Rieske (2Fe-2S) protein [Planctomycetaceae bacterium]
MTVETSVTPASPSPPPRRSFLVEAAAVAAGAVVALAPLGAGLAFLADPLLRRRPTMQGASADGYLPVATLAELPSDGTPLRFSIIADKVDAWNLFKKQTVGTVYLRQIAGQVIAFNDTCPHLGCKVDYKAADKSYFCPCHASSFNLDGGQTNRIPPRGMDALDTRVTDGTIWVKYQNFQRGTEAKTPVT